MGTTHRETNLPQGARTELAPRDATSHGTSQANVARARIVPRLDVVGIARRLYALGYDRVAVMRGIDALLAATFDADVERNVRRLRGQALRVRRTAARRRAAEAARLLSVGPTAA
jgi:hypothetical protein